VVAACRPAKWLSSAFASFDYTAPVTLPRRKLLLVEFNEISWSVVDQLITERRTDVVCDAPDVPRGTRLEACNNRDLAPTMLWIHGIAPPSHLTGRAPVHLA
jgi:hypothetical protein